MSARPPERKGMFKTSQSQQLSRGGGEGAGQNQVYLTPQWDPELDLGFNMHQEECDDADSLEFFHELAMELSQPLTPPLSPPSLPLAAPPTVLFKTELSGLDISSSGRSSQQRMGAQQQGKAQAGRKRRTNAAAAARGSCSAAHGAGQGRDKAAAQSKAAACRHAEEAEKQVQALVLRHEEQQAVNARLKQNISFLQGYQKQLETDQKLLLAVHRSPSPATRIPASCSEVSFAGLPHASEWDDAWVARVRQLSCQDLLVLRRQWLQQSALLLPAAEMHGPGSAAYERLAGLHGRHIALVQGVVSLMPETWLRMSQFDMESLQPVAALDRNWLSSLFHQMFPEDVVAAAMSISRDYAAQSRRLGDEYRLLLGQYNLLAAGAGLRDASRRALPAGYRKLPGSCSATPTLGFQPCHPSAAAGAATGGDDVLTELDAVAQLIQSNTGKQLALLKQFLCRMQHSRLPPGNVKIGLLTYPLAVNALDLSSGLLPSAEHQDQ